MYIVAASAMNYLPIAVYIDTGFVKDICFSPIVVSVKLSEYVWVPVVFERSYACFLVRKYKC